MRSTDPAYPPSFPFSLENFIADDQAAAHDHQRLKLFFSSSSVPNAGASCSLSFPAFFDTLVDQSTGISSTSTTIADQALVYNNQTANKGIWKGETSYDQACSSPSIVQLNSDDSNEKYHKLSLCTDDTNEDHEPVNWTPSAMKQPDQVPAENNIPLTLKIRTARRDDQHRETNTGETSKSSSLAVTNKKSSSSGCVSAARVCSDCSTSTTPLWRSGPQGPKSLCNACGIRQRKARRSLAEAAAATGLGGGTTRTATTAAAITAKPSLTSKGKEKKSSQNHNVRVSCENRRKLIMTDESTSVASPCKYYKRADEQLGNLKQVAAFPPSVLFPLDVEEAAILLMDLSSALCMNNS